MPTVLRRLLLWTVICTISAAPSFVWAHQNYDRAAMFLGVLLFIAVYTIATSTERFARFHALPFIRRTLYIGYGLRLLLSIIYPLGMGADLFPGMWSVNSVEWFMNDSHSFGGTLAITIVQGTQLNVILFLVMGAIYGLQRAFLKPPVYRPRGFDIVLPAQPLSQPTR